MRIAILSALLLGRLFGQTVVDRGISVEFSVVRVDAPANKTLREGDDVRVRFKLTDAAGGSPITAFPTAWIQRTGTTKPSCNDMVSRLLNYSRAEVDLNSYHVLTLNDDATISVVDPLFGYGGSKLLALVPLPAPGEDWSLTPSGDMLFVTVPDAGEVTAVDTATWKVVAHIPLPARPRRVAVQPDGAYVWVTLDSGDSAAPAVAVIATGNLQPMAEIATGPGQHALAFSSDSRWAAMTNSSGASVSLIDVRQLKKARDFPAGREPVSIAYSNQAKMFYSTDRAEGLIVALEPNAPREAARIRTETGIGDIQFAPDGRLAFIPNPEKDLLHIIDTASNRIIQTADVKHGPDQVGFSSGIAYVRCRRSETVLMVPLDAVGKTGKLLSIADFPGGQHTFGEVGRPSPASSFAKAPGENAMLVANPADKAIYYFQEGLPAPMGSFSNYGRQARAVLVVDRSLRAAAQGVYETIARLPAAGEYMAALLVDSPRVVQCFNVIVQPNPQLVSATPRLQVEVPKLPEPLHARQTVRVRVRLTAPDGKKPSQLADVRIVTILETGVWHLRQHAEPEGDGVYGVDLIPPSAGRYQIAVECLSAGLSFNQSPQYVVEALPPVAGK
jgi:YVTN family beta-propeller protein